MPVLLAWGFIIKVCMQTFSLLTSKLREEIEVTLTIQKFMVKMIFLWNGNFLHHERSEQECAEKFISMLFFNVQKVHIYLIYAYMHRNGEHVCLSVCRLYVCSNKSDCSSSSGGHDNMILKQIWLVEQFRGYGNIISPSMNDFCWAAFSCAAHGSGGWYIYTKNLTKGFDFSVCFNLVDLICQTDLDPEPCHDNNQLFILILFWCCHLWPVYFWKGL